MRRASPQGLSRGRPQRLLRTAFTRGPTRRRTARAGVALGRMCWADCPPDSSGTRTVKLWRSLAGSEPDSPRPVRQPANALPAVSPRRAPALSLRHGQRLKMRAIAWTDSSRKCVVGNVRLGWSRTMRGRPGAGAGKFEVGPEPYHARSGRSRTMRLSLCEVGQEPENLRSTRSRTKPGRAGDGKCQVGPEADNARSGWIRAM